MRQNGAPGCCCPAPEPGGERQDVQRPPPSSQGAPGDIVWLPGGKSFVGTDMPVLKADGEGPRRTVRLKPFGLECFAVTNDRFRAFVEDTGYRTDAERYGWSFVFHLFLDPESRFLAPVDATWWRRVDGACWSAPEGPGSSLAERGDHPVVHISWNDAAAFAAWCGGRLPNEAEWEFAARGGDAGARFPWGTDEPSDERIHCNIWQGRFPDFNSAIDGYAGTAPVDAFAGNGFGLFNMAGNVWEWCSDHFRVRSLSALGKRRNAEAGREQERVMKGGSYLCHISYCYRYRIAARTGRPADTSAGHTGFRVAYDG